LDNVQARADGMPDNSGWKLSYDELVRRFLKEAPISTPRRRLALERNLKLNLLGLRAGSDFANKGKLNSACMKLLESRTDIFVIKWIQQPLKQISAWAACCGIFPYDPLAAWKKLPRSSSESKRYAFTPVEMRAIFAAAEELDALFGRKFSSALLFEALLVTGNRPGALFQTRIGDFDGERIKLPEGHGNKRNGRATVNPEFAAEIKAYIEGRGTPDSKQPLFLSANGVAIDKRNVQEDFKQAATLAFVRAAWPANDPLAIELKPVEVALAIYKGRLPGFDGPPPRDPVKIAARDKKREMLSKLIEKLKSDVETKLENRPMYSLRHTHISWARRLVNLDAVKAQVGHAGRDIEEKHYLDMQFVDASESAQAVWDVLTGVRDISVKKPAVGPVQKMAPVVAPDAEKSPENKNEHPDLELEVVGAGGVETGGLDGTRTRDLRRDKPTL